MFSDDQVETGDISCSDGGSIVVSAVLGRHLCARGCYFSNVVVSIPTPAADGVITNREVALHQLVPQLMQIDDDPGTTDSETFGGRVQMVESRVDTLRAEVRDLCIAARDESAMYARQTQQDFGALVIPVKEMIPVVLKLLR